MDGAALTRCQLRRGREHSSALGMQYGWGSTYSLSVEEGKGGIHQPWACGMDGAALTPCQLRRGREHSSVGMRHGWGSTYKLLVEEGKGAFISPGHAAWMGQHLHTVS